MDRRDAADAKTSIGISSPAGKPPLLSKTSSAVTDGTAMASRENAGKSGMLREDSAASHPQQFFPSVPGGGMFQYAARPVVNAPTMMQPVSADQQYPMMAIPAGTFFSQPVSTAGYRLVGEQQPRPYFPPPLAYPAFPARASTALPGYATVPGGPIPVGMPMYHNDVMPQMPSGQAIAWTHHGPVLISPVLVTGAAPAEVPFPQNKRQRSTPGSEASDSDSYESYDDDKSNPYDNSVPRIKGAWSKKEDKKLTQLVSELGPRWSLIAERLPGRIGKQCRERYLNHLDHSIKRTPWTPAEDSILLDAHKERGNKWSEIARMLPGRPENAVKNRYMSLAHRMLRLRTEEPEAPVEQTKPQTVEKEATDEVGEKVAGEFGDAILDPKG